MKKAFMVMTAFTSSVARFSQVQFRPDEHGSGPVLNGSNETIQNLIVPKKYS